MMKPYYWQKLLSLAVPLFMAAHSALAAPRSFLVVFRNGESVRFNLTERPTLTFNNDQGIMMVSTLDVQMEFDLTEIEKSEFSDIVSVESVEDGNATALFDFTSMPEHILISGVSRADVYNISGMLVITAKAEFDRIDIDTADLAPGVYAVHTAVRSIKFTKP